jgi:hypothetical protein
MSLVVGAYSYSCSCQGGGSIISSISNVSGSTAVSNTSYTIASNTLTNCSAASVTAGGGGSSGANDYGGAMSLVVGAYSYSLSGGGSSISSSSSSSISGSTAVSNTSYTIASNTLNNCSALSVTAGGGGSSGANAYGGGMSLAVGAYSYSLSSGGSVSSSISISSVSGSTAVSNTSYTIASNTLTNCSASSQNEATSNGANCFGGAVAVVYGASSFSGNSSSILQAMSLSSSLRVVSSTFLNCYSMTSSASCASGTSNAAGGAVFSSAPSVAFDTVSSSFTNCSAVVKCAASISTYSLGGGLSIMKAGKVSVTSTNFTSCSAQGVPQANNVLVSGGGLQVQTSDSLILQNCLISGCSVLNAVSTFLPSGGGALGTQNVSAVNISWSNFRGNTDSSATGTIFLQHLEDGSAMDVRFDHSFVSVEPSSTPAVSISCGSNCSILQQQRISISFQNSNFSAISMAAQKFDSSAIMTLPNSWAVYSENSFLNCSFNFTNNVAIYAATNDQSLSVSCTPCAHLFEIAWTSSALALKDLREAVNLGQQQCRTLPSSSAQQCPFGVNFCSTIINMTVGFWASFVDGNLSKATRCPTNYCGCRNIQGFSGATCQLLPPLAPEFQPDVSTNDALCNGNRCGVLCGGCKPGFTQSLDGYSCITNDACMQNVGWTWAVTIIGYVIYGIYIVVSSLQADDGLVMCLLFYGQISLFASVSQSNSSGAGTPRSAISAWFARVTQFESITSLYSQTCYGSNMGAYAVTAAQLTGPAIVLFFAIILTVALKRAQPLLERRKINVVVSIPATLSVVILLLFSSVTTVAFKLVTCAKITDQDTDNVVFIDGTVKCYDSKWYGLIAVIVILCLFPLVFVAALRWKRLPHNVRAAVCSAYSESRFYWGAVTLFFRLVMSVVFATIREYPSTAALVQSFLCVAMLILLMHLRPYHYAPTYCLDVLCYASLIVQFMLEILVRDSDSLGVVPGTDNPFSNILHAAVEVSVALRFVHPSSSVLVVLLSQT